MERDELDLDSYPKAETAIVVIEGKRIVIGPFRGPQFAMAMRLARPVLGYFAAFSDVGEQRIDWAYLIEKHFEPLCELCDLQLGWEPGTAGQRLMPDQMVDLLRAILRVNLDFFFQRIRPSLGRLTQDVESYASASQRHGSGSSPADIRRMWSWLTPWRRSPGGSRR